MISQKQELQLQQKLSPRQILLMRLLQIPVASLEQRIEQELEENPALELAEDETENEESTLDDAIEDDDFSFETETADNKEEESFEELNTDLNIDDYFAEDYANSDYIPASSNASKEEEQTNQDWMYVSNESFQESLLAQLGIDRKSTRLNSSH